MIRITDRTLSCLNNVDAKRSDLLHFLRLLIATEVDAIELSQEMYNLLSPLPDYPAYVLRVEDPLEIMKYQDISHFVCHNAEKPFDSCVCAEILLNDIREAYTIARYADYSKIRIQGLNDVLLGNYKRTFENIKKSFRGEIEFCPSNHLHMATALAFEWVTNGISENIVTSFCGIGGFAPTEEIIIILKERRMRKVGKKYLFFPEMASFIEKVTGKRVRENKAILGRHIFHVESGIHVDGVVKQPKCYEPFPPEVIGQTRKVILGKQSGTASIRVKLDELGIEYYEDQVLQILKQVKITSTEKNGALTDEEFGEIVRRCVL